MLTLKFDLRFSHLRGSEWFLCSKIVCIAMKPSLHCFPGLISSAEWPYTVLSVFFSVVTWRRLGKFVRWFDRILMWVIMRLNISLFRELWFWFWEPLFRTFLQFPYGYSFFSCQLMRSFVLLGHILLHMLKVMFLFFLSFHVLYKSLNICRSNLGAYSQLFHISRHPSPQDDHNTYIYFSVFFTYLDISSSPNISW